MLIENICVATVLLGEAFDDMRETDDFRTPSTSPKKKSTTPQSGQSVSWAKGHTEDFCTTPTSPEKYVGWTELNMEGLGLGEDAVKKESPSK
jgi:hypothetical protein